MAAEKKPAPTRGFERSSQELEPGPPLERVISIGIEWIPDTFNVLMASVRPPSVATYAEAMHGVRRASRLEPLFPGYEPFAGFNYGDMIAGLSVYTRDGRTNVWKGRQTGIEWANARTPIQIESTPLKDGPFTSMVVLASTRLRVGLLAPDPSGAGDVCYDQNFWDPDIFDPRFECSAISRGAKTVGAINIAQLLALVLIQPPSGGNPLAVTLIGLCNWAGQLPQQIRFADQMNLLTFWAFGGRRLYSFALRTHPSGVAGRPPAMEIIKQIARRTLLAPPTANGPAPIRRWLAGLADGTVVILGRPHIIYTAGGIVQKSNYGPPLDRGLTPTTRLFVDNAGFLRALKLGAPNTAGSLGLVMDTLVMPRAWPFPHTPGVPGVRIFRRPNMFIGVFLVAKAALHRPNAPFVRTLGATRDQMLRLLFIMLTLQEFSYVAPFYARQRLALPADDYSEPVPDAEGPFVFETA